jgi:signal transduction histidine kinase
VSYGERAPARVVADVSGVLAATVGAVVMGGWLSHTDWLVRLRESQVPVQFNTALGLVLLGVALLLLPTARCRWAAVPAGVAAVVGWVTLAEHALGRSLGIDTLLFDPWLVGDSAPGRMARNTSLCFVLLGTAVVLLVLTRLEPGGPARALGLSASVVAALAIVALFGYASGVSAAYAWRRNTTMAPLSAVAFLVTAVGYGAAAYRVASSGGTAPRWLPLPVALGALAASLALWQALVSVGARGRTIPVDRAAGAVLGLGVVLSALVGTASALGQAAIRRRRVAEQESERRAEAQRALVERSERDAVLREAYAAVALSDDLATGFARFGDAVARGTDVDRVALTVVDGETATVVAVTGTGAGAVPVGSRLAANEPVIRDTIAARGPTLVNDVAKRYPGSPAARAGMRSFVSTPIVIGGSARAVLTVSSTRNDAFDADSVTFVGDVAALTGGALYTLARLDDERAHTARLRELDQLKNEFVGVVAHDLRSPMTVIAGYVDMVLLRWDETTDDTKRELLGVASRNVKRLSVLVEDVLQVARIEAGDFAFDVRPFDLGALVERTVAEMNDARPDRSVVALVRPGLPLAHADEDRQWQVLTNLLSNAQKFSPEDAPVEVRVEVLPRDLAVSVADRGRGIAPEDLSRLFGKFSRLGAAPGGEKGTGLGLYICKALVEAQGGTIEAASEPGRGTTLRYTVPRVGSEDE